MCFWVLNWIDFSKKLSLHQSILSACCDDTLMNYFPNILTTFSDVFSVLNWIDCIKKLPLHLSILTHWTLYSIVYIIHWISFQMCFSVLICIVLGQKLSLQLSLLIACRNKHSTGTLPHQYCSFFSTSFKRSKNVLQIC